MTRLLTNLGWPHQTAASVLVLLLGAINASQAQIGRPGDDLGDVQGPNVPEMDLYGALLTDRIVASFFAKFIYLSELIN